MLESLGVFGGIGSILISLVGFVIGIFIYGLIILLITKIFKIKTASYKKSLIVALLVLLPIFLLGVLAALINMILGYSSAALVVSGILGVLIFLVTWVGCHGFLAWFLIKKKFNLDTRKSLFVWLAYFGSIIAIKVILFIVILIVTLLVVALGLGGMGLAGLI